MTTALPQPISTVRLYLRVQVQARFQAAVSMELAQEALIAAPQRFTLLPNQPAWVMGLFNYRNRVIWALDLPLLLGLTPLDFSPQDYHLVVMRPSTGLIGLAVQQVKGVTRIPADKISALEPGSLREFCLGQVMEPTDPLWILDPEAIAHHIQQIATP
ncbi:MAG: chemotaxis protein CheW [Cyanophyceae cyanobacterium]